MKFIIIHGAYGSPEENWFPYIKEELENLGQKVIIPQFPVDDWDEAMKVGKKYKFKQGLKPWLETFEKEVLPQIKGEDKLCFIGHSLGCVFILHVVEKYKLNLDCAIFVSPFLEKLGMWEFDVPNKSFYKTDFDLEELRKRIPLSYKIHSDNDPYVKASFSDNFAKLLDSNLILIKGGKHISSGANIRQLPIALELCKGRLDLSIYQKYLKE